MSLELDSIRLAMKETIYTQTINELTDKIAYEQDINKVFNTALEIITKVTMAEAATIWIYRISVDRIYPFAVYGGSKLSDIVLKPNEGVAGKVIATGKSALVDNVHREQSWSNNADSKSGFQTKTMVCVPGIYKNQCYGCLQLVNRINDECFDEKDLQFIQTLCNHVMTLLEKNDSFYKFVEKESKKGAEQLRVQFATNLLTFMDNTELDDVVQAFENLDKVKEMGSLERMGFLSKVKALWKAARKLNEEN